MKDLDLNSLGLSDARSSVVRLAEIGRKINSGAFSAPQTLGMPTDKRTKAYKEVLAMDTCLKGVLSGYKSFFEFNTTPMFAGYALLSNIAQEALIRAGVETIADEMTRKLVTWTYDDDDDKDDKKKTDLISKMDTECAKYKVKERFNEAMQKDGYFGGCLVYIDMGDLDDEEKIAIHKGDYRSMSILKRKLGNNLQIRLKELYNSDEWKSSIQLKKQVRKVY